MSTAKSIEQVASIVRIDPERRFVVVSAPGKRDKADIKITDVLYECYRDAKTEGNCKERFSLIRNRYRAIVADLKLNLDIDMYLDAAEKEIVNSKSPDYAASRGEYLNALIMAEYLGFDFVDAYDVIKFKEDGTPDFEYTNDLVEAKLKTVKHAVIPGFYGSLPNGEIKTFSRGGSDITGAIIARGANASVYENWTDVNGFMIADPKIVNQPKNIQQLSYKELRELSYMGASVLHPDSIFPVRFSSIPINIKNTFNPENPGTMIVPYITMEDEGACVITGIAGRKNFVSVNIEKSMMNSEIGFARKVLSVLEHYGISFEHMPSGIDTLSIVICASELENGKLDRVVTKLREAVNPDSIEVVSNLALIATVGHGMSFKTGTAGRLFSALSRANVNIRMIDQGSSELNIIVGVEDKDYETSIRAIYEEFVG